MAAGAGGEDDGLFSCRRCRAPLFRAADLSEHEAGQHEFAYRRAEKSRRGGAAGTGDCTSYFLREPLRWMAGVATSGETEGKLACPKCATRVGSLRWAGMQCSCGTWVTPAIQIGKKAVDARIRSVLLPVTTAPAVPVAAADAAPAEAAAPAPAPAPSGAGR